MRIGAVSVDCQPGRSWFDQKQRSSFRLEKDRAERDTFVSERPAKGQAKETQRKCRF
jgi:hypothetical protein